MIINFDDIEQQTIEGFKGGKGILLSKTMLDNKCRIMLSTLKPGASSGLHVHGVNSEVIFVLQGPITFHDNGVTEVAETGQVHYCKMGHEHYFENLSEHDVVYFALVTEHH